MRPIVSRRLTAAAAALSLCAAALLGLTLHPTEPFAFENPLLLWLHAHTVPAMTCLSLALHFFGKPLYATLFILCLSSWLWYRGRVRHALLLALGTGLSAALMHYAKLFFLRSRPELWPRLVEETGASFPSGHATYAAALAAALFINHRRSPQHALWLAGGILFALAMGLSRLILGVHYPTDIAAGWITGTACVVLLHTLLPERQTTASGRQP
ncbi:phosphatase PAP2 family protein [Neisseria leonii]|uniref:phosphatase PAP2 family protein n=1 Tax=Neisseria leonii TaxID=2995413 RepID=UPI0030D2D963